MAVRVGEVGHHVEAVFLCIGAVKGNGLAPRGDCVVKEELQFTLEAHLVIPDGRRRGDPDVTVSGNVGKVKGRHLEGLRREGLRGELVSDSPGD